MFGEPVLSVGLEGRVESFEHGKMNAMLDVSLWEPNLVRFLPFIGTELGREQGRRLLGE